MPQPTQVRVKSCLDALDQYVDARVDYVTSCRHVEAMETRLQGGFGIVGGEAAMEEVRRLRAEKEKRFKEKRHELQVRLTNLVR